jgi:hypothetical protein
MEGEIYRGGPRSDGGEMSGGAGIGDRTRAEGAVDGLGAQPMTTTAGPAEAVVVFLGAAPMVSKELEAGSPAA